MRSLSLRHDLAVIGQGCEHASVMQQRANAALLSCEDRIARRLAHAYTKRLLAACGGTLAIA